MACRASSAYLALAAIALLPTLASAACSTTAGEATEALAVLRTAVSDDPLGALRTWVPDETPCNYTGVTCDRNGCVTRLYLGGKKLAGQWRDVLGAVSRLRDLVYLHLGSNAFGGELGAIKDAPLAQNVHLEYVYLDHQAPRPGGGLPADALGLGRASKLRFLLLAGLGFEGGITNAFVESLPEGLAYLDLGRNRLTGAVPASLARLRSAQWLWLDSNDLAGVLPSSVPPSCESFKVHQNPRLCGRVPPGFAAVVPSLVGTALNGPCLDGEGSIAISTLLLNGVVLDATIMSGLADALCDAANATAIGLSATPVGVSVTATLTITGADADLLQESIQALEAALAAIVGVAPPARLIVVSVEPVDVDPHDRRHRRRLAHEQHTGAAVKFSVWIPLSGGNVEALESQVGTVTASLADGNSIVGFLSAAGLVPKGASGVLSTPEVSTVVAVLAAADTQDPAELATAIYNCVSSGSLQGALEQLGLGDVIDVTAVLNNDDVPTGLGSLLPGVTVPVLPALPPNPGFDDWVDAWSGVEPAEPIIDNNYGDSEGSVSIPRPEGTTGALLEALKRAWAASLASFALDWLTT